MISFAENINYDPLVTHSAFLFVHIICSSLE